MDLAIQQEHVEFDVKDGGVVDQGDRAGIFTRETLDPTGVGSDPAD